MPIRVVCPECLSVYHIADHLGGKIFRCRSCEAHVPVPNDPPARAPAEKVTAAPPRVRSLPAEAEEDLAPRKKKRDGKTGRGKKKSGSFFAMLPVWAWLALIGGGGLVLIGTCFGGGFLIWRGLSSSESKAPATHAVAAKKTADQLVAEFSTNYTVAKENYDGKWIEISGYVGKVDGSEIILTYGGQDMALERIQCRFASGQKKQLKTLQLGQAITVQGKFAGKQYNFIVFEDCVLTQSGSAGFPDHGSDDDD
jgi:hypothetical protein